MKIMDLEINSTFYNSLISYHMKYISLDHNDVSNIELNQSYRYCCNCILEIFPFGHIEYNNLLITEVNSMDFELKAFEDLSTKLFNPFGINNYEIYYPLCDIDIDAHYFNDSNALSAKFAGTFTFKYYSKQISKHERSQKGVFIMPY